MRRTLFWIAFYASLVALGAYSRPILVAMGLRAPPHRPTPRDVRAFAASSPQAAIAEANRVIAARPEDPDAHALLFAAHAELRKSEDLPALYEKLASTHPGSPRIRMERARALLRTGRAAEARPILDALAAERVRDRDLTTLRAEVHLSTGEAREVIALLLPLEPLGHEERRLLARACEGEGDRGGAISIWRELADTRGEAEDLLGLATALRRAGLLAEAEPKLRALANDPRIPPEAEAELALLYADRAAGDLFRPDDALAHAEAASRRGGARYDALAVALEAAGERDLARLTAETALEDPHASEDVRRACRALLATPAR